MNNRLGKLDPVELRYSWEDEAADFTPWLAQPENLELLAETIGMDELELVGTEQSVGDFSIDILTKDMEGHYVIIENQLEKTNHDHLGKLITYAAGMGATAVIWIARTFREEHRKALEWLNDATLPGINFFGIQLELWRIGNSAAAPRFNLVSQPNEWGKRAKASGQEAGTTEGQRLWLEFWSQFVDFCNEKGTSLRLRHAADQGWFIIALGRARMHLSLRCRPRLGTIRCGLFIQHPQSVEAFEQLRHQKKEIEAELGPLEWAAPERDGGRARIDQSRQANPEDRHTWPELFGWLKERAEAFHAAFAPRVRALNLEAEEEE